MTSFLILIGVLFLFGLFGLVWRLLSFGAMQQRIDRERHE